MISRYSLPEMTKIWSEDERFRKMFEVELAASEHLAKKGVIPAKTVDVIRRRAVINTARIKAIEAVVKHDVIAFLDQLEESAGPGAKHLHFGMTSSDVMDTVTDLQMKASCALIIKKLKNT